MSLSGERSHLEPGYRLDRYELLCPIAHGGMASVWLARLHGKHGFEKLVAVKTILPQYASDPRFERMFLDEARIAAGIEHANVAQILDLGEQHEVLYLVMEWIDGDSLSKLHRAVRKRDVAIPMGVVLRIVADIAAGLHAAHELRDPSGENLGVVHRDVSPQNILVSVSGAAKLIDFGIAKARDRVSADTSAGLLKGKIQYMPPEQAVGKSVDRRSDVWALGAVMYYLLAGVPPYDAANQLATLHLLTSGDPPPPLPDTFPPEMDALCRKAMAHDPEERIQTAAELQRAIESLMITAGCHTTAGDVAAFVHEHLGERAEARRKAVELALAASAERKRVQALLTPETVEGDSSDSARSSSPQRASQPTSVPPSVRGASSGPISATAPAIPSQPPEGVEEDAQSAEAPEETDEEEPISQVSSGTLRSAVIPFSGSVPPSSTPTGPESLGGLGRKQQLWAVGLGVLGAASFIIVVALASSLFRGRGSQDEATKAPEPRAVAPEPALTIAERAPSLVPAPEPTSFVTDAAPPLKEATKETKESKEAPAASAPRPTPSTKPSASAKTATRPGQKDYGF
ncbi:protein kinase [Pendulispora brunnea]|uniref:Protein kinase n=1 Tax=Pendulispora brunnea TaxID=2905690 RepID=A0ABZ2KHQ7_9BACT